jgi:hypothetical protein
VGAVACGGEDGQHVFHLAVVGVIGPVAAAATTSARVDPDCVPLGQQSLGEGEGVGIADGTADEHDWANRDRCGGPPAWCHRPM